MFNAPLPRSHFDLLDSTQSEAKRQIAAKMPAPFWITADIQSAGRGRLGREWVSPKGNYLASLVLHWPEGAITASQMSFVAGLALYNTLEELGAHDLALKWPNDVLIDGQKVAGILLEYLDEHLIIGIGVNIAYAPQAENLAPRALPPIALNPLININAERFHHIFEGEMILALTQFRNFGFEPIRKAVSSRLWARADMVYEDGNSSEIMRVIGIDETGALIIDGEHGRRKVMAGDIYPAKKGQDAAGD